MQDDEFRAFYQEHARRLWAYLARLTGDPTAADDIAQEAFLRMLTASAAARLTGEHRKNYLYKVATNLARRHLRRPRDEALVNTLGEPLEEEPDEILAVRQALSRMKESERGLLWLAYVEGFSHREIARMLGYREQSIRPLLHRARAKLVRLLRRVPGRLRKGEKP